MLMFLLHVILFCLTAVEMSTTDDKKGKQTGRPLGSSERLVHLVGILEFESDFKSHFGQSSRVIRRHTIQYPILMQTMNQIIPSMRN